METLNIANLDNAFAHSSSETRWLIRMGLILNILRVNPRKLRRGNLLEKLGGSDSYKNRLRCCGGKKQMRGWKVKYKFYFQ